MADSIRDRRTQYETAGIDVGDLDPDPMTQWRTWHAEALDAGIVEPNAMTLSTVGSDGTPDARMVLVRGADAGFEFYTNYDSPKSRQLRTTPVASATFGWLDLHRQVRARGTVEAMSAADNDAYFASRPRGSQLGAWASPQSEVIVDRDTLDRLVAHATVRFADADVVPRPDNWGGWRLVPTEWEFWQGRPSRLHDRLRYRPGDGRWVIDRLAP